MASKEKMYFVFTNFKDSINWAIGYVRAENANKARYKVIKLGYEVGDQDCYDEVYQDIYARRCPSLDGLNRDIDLNEKLSSTDEKLLKENNLIGYRDKDGEEEMYHSHKPLSPDVTRETLNKEKLPDNDRR